MTKRHLKRIAAPDFGKIARKKSMWITRPNPGPHPLRQCLTLDLIIREKLKFADTQRESKKAIKSGQILVDQRVTLDHKRPVGLMDVLSLKDMNYRVVLNKKNSLVLIEIPETQKHLKLCKVTGKKVQKKGKIQINLHDGRSILVTDNKIKVNDSLILNLTTGKIEEHIPFEKGCAIYLTGGSHPGTIAFYEGVKKTSSLVPDLLIVKSGKEVFETAKSYAFAVGKSAPSLVISPEKKGGEK